MRATLLQRVRDESGCSIDDLLQRPHAAGAVVDRVFDEWLGAGGDEIERSGGTPRPLVIGKYREVGEPGVGPTLAAQRCLLGWGQVTISLDGETPVSHALLLQHFQPFVDNGSVRFVPDLRVSSLGWWQTAHHLYAGEGEEGARDGRWDNENLFRHYMLRRRTALEIAHALDLTVQHRRAADLACQTRSQLQQLQFITERCLHLARPHNLDRLHFAPALLRLKLPDFRASPDDLLAIQDAGLFGRWQAALEEGLRHAASVPTQDLVDPSSAEMREVRKSLEAAAASLGTTVRTSSRFSSLVTQSLNMGLASASGALGAALAGAAGAAALGGATYAATAVLDWLGDRPAQGERAFKRLIPVVFGEQ